MPPASAIAFELSTLPFARFHSAPAAFALASADSPVLTSAIRGAMPPASAIAFELSTLPFARFLSAPVAFALASADSPVLT
eukprot:8647707-Pyramimonas_sp.AAC.1